MTKKIKKEKVYREYVLDLSKIRYGNIESIINYLNEVKKKIPPDSDIRFDLYSNSWNSEIEKIYFAWYETETDEEAKQRIIQEKIAQEEFLNNLKKHEEIARKNLKDIQKKMADYGI